MNTTKMFLPIWMDINYQWLLFSFRLPPIHDHVTVENDIFHVELEKA